MPSVRAKFRVEKITRQNNWNGSKELRTVSLSPVYGGNDPNHENAKFWQASPSGSLELGCINLDAAEAFELGKEYYIDFTPADPPLVPYYE